MWRFVGAEKGLEPIPGIPLAAEDEAFAAAVEVYEAQFGPEGAGSVGRSGLYEHVSERKGGPVEPAPVLEGESGCALVVPIRQGKRANDEEVT